MRNRAGGNVILVASAEPVPLAELAHRAAGSLDREEVMPLTPP